jgi:hypothetical protein
MTWGIPTEAFVQIHVGLSLIGIVSGLVVLGVVAVVRPRARADTAATQIPRRVG